MERHPSEYELTALQLAWLHEIQDTKTTAEDGTTNIRSDYGMQVQLITVNSISYFLNEFMFCSCRWLKTTAPTLPARPDRHVNSPAVLHTQL